VGTENNDIIRLMAKKKSSLNVRDLVIVGLIVSNLVLIYLVALLWQQANLDNQQATYNIYKNAAQTSKLETCFNQNIKPCN
jgi:amino acid permease